MNPVVLRCDVNNPFIFVYNKQRKLMILSPRWQHLPHVKIIKWKLHHLGSSSNHY